LSRIGSELREDVEGVCLPLGTKGGGQHSLAGEGTRFGRLDRKPGILFTLCVKICGWPDLMPLHKRSPYLGFLVKDSKHALFPSFIPEYSASCRLTNHHLLSTCGG